MFDKIINELKMKKLIKIFLIINTLLFLLYAFAMHDYVDIHKYILLAIGNNFITQII